MNLLLVDDERLALEMLEDAVSEALPGASCAAFTDATEALEYAANNPIDIAFLDINMVAISGLEFAKHLIAQYSKVNIIFCTGYEEYALDAMRMYASAFLTKPIFAESISDAMQHLRFPVQQPKRVRFHCFGNFEVFCDGIPIAFKFSRTKELLAYLVDRDGVDCTTQEILAAAFEDSISRMYLSQMRNDLIDSFDALGAGDALRVSRGVMAVQRSAVDCDYFDYRDGKLNIQITEYMTQYSFGEATLATLL